MELAKQEGEYVERKYVTRLVEIFGLTDSVIPRVLPGEPDPLPVQANGLRGRAVDFRPDTQKYIVCTFDAVHLDIAEENLKFYEHPSSEEGGFDLAWPYYEEAFFEFCANVNSQLTSKNWTLIQVFKTKEQREDALAKAKRKDFEVPKPEFHADFLGRKGKGKVSYVNPLEIMDEDDARRVPEPKNDLERYDLDMTSLFAVMGPMTWDSMGFQSFGRTEAMCWVPFASSREENALVPEPLNDDDVEEEGMVERHIQFIRRRKLCFLYMVDNEGGSITLHPRSDLKMAPVTMPVEKGRLLIFRSDLMAYTFTPQGPHLTLQVWVLEAPPKIELGDIVASSENLTEALGIYQGPLVPQGARAHIMAGSCLTGGGTWSLEEASCMYLSGTDAHVYVPNSRFDTDLYFTKDGDKDLIPFANSYHHHGGLCYDAEVMSFDCDFFGYTEHQASLMQPAQHKTLEVGYETLFRAGWTKKSVMNQPVLVYVGDCGCEWWNNLLVRQMHGEHMNGDKSATLQWEEGRSITITGQRLSYNLGMRGPAWVCDTACSSGLTAFCTAMYSIKKPTIRGTESPSVDAHAVGALAGGTNMIVDAGVYVGACGQHMLSLKGRCFTFDMSGDGYARGEGTSMCYVMISNNDRDTEMQEACAIGNKVNQDGRSASMTAPNGPSQQMCIKASLKEAGVEPHDITASECHGTGTSLGDPIEVGSLRGVQETDERDGPIMNTSSKSNIGHLEANAGTTGLFKCILMSKYGVGLPNCHLRTLNPHLDVSGWPTYMISESADYNQQSGLVGVSSFGVSGTNAHAEVWSYCRSGPNMAGRKKLNTEVLKQITLTCPVTLGPIDYLTGEPARADGKKMRADCLRGELAQYDVSSAVYEGDYRYRREDDGAEPLNPYGVTVNIQGSWSGFTSYDEMTESEDGPYVFNVVLGETRCESFFICLNGVPDYKFWPVVNEANEQVWVEGPDPSPKSEGKRWMIDGRDLAVPAGTVYQIKFHWGTGRKKVTWEQVDAASVPPQPRYPHRYQLKGSWTSSRMDDMKKTDDGVWEFLGKIGTTGQEEFQIFRDYDEQQCIYPGRPRCVDTKVPVRGPDDMGRGKCWSINGPVGENVKVRLEVSDGQIIVAASSKSTGEKVWESVQGWERHSYWASFQGGPCLQLTMDPETPGVFRARMQVGSNYSEKFRGFCEFFNVIVDEDPNYGFFPDVTCASSGECIVWGPVGGVLDKAFMVKSWQVGAGFEVVLDVNAVDRRKRVTWVWDVPPQYGFSGGVAVLDG
uniref:Type I polyketide synthase n=1 Tax=Gambierdiscus polynesiensis TaxID=439318 RepID=A0A1S6K7U5_9DINO|nr:type I polyketide synthase [Gambierdiscus polynesiensis]